MPSVELSEADGGVLAGVSLPDILARMATTRPNVWKVAFWAQLALGVAFANVTAGQAAGAVAPGDSDGSVTAGLDASEATYGDFNASLAADRDVGSETTSTTTARPASGWSATSTA